MPKGENGITYFYLVKYTEKGIGQSAERSRTERDAITRRVKEARGSCRLWATPGGAYDYVSVITGISPEAALQIALLIEQNGEVRVTLLSGLSGPIVRK